MRHYEKYHYGLRSIAKVRFFAWVYPAINAYWHGERPSGSDEPQRHSLAYRRILPQEILQQSPKAARSSEEKELRLPLYKFRTTDILYGVLRRMP